MPGLGIGQPCGSGCCDPCKIRYQLADGDLATAWDTVSGDWTENAEAKATDSATGMILSKTPVPAGSSGWVLEARIRFYATGQETPLDTMLPPSAVTDPPLQVRALDAECYPVYWGNHPGTSTLRVVFNYQDANNFWCVQCTSGRSYTGNVSPRSASVDDGRYREWTPKVHLIRRQNGAEVVVATAPVTFQVSGDATAIVRICCGEDIRVDVSKEGGQVYHMWAHSTPTENADRVGIGVRANSGTVTLTKFELRRRAPGVITCPDCSLTCGGVRRTYPQYGIYLGSQKLGNAPGTDDGSGNRWDCCGTIIPGLEQDDPQRLRPYDYVLRQYDFTNPCTFDYAGQVMNNHGFTCTTGGYGVLYLSIRLSFSGIGTSVWIALSNNYAAYWDDLLEYNAQWGVVASRYGPISTGDLGAGFDAEGAWGDYGADIRWGPKNSPCVYSATNGYYTAFPPRIRIMRIPSVWPC